MRNIKFLGVVRAQTLRVKPNPTSSLLRAQKLNNNQKWDVSKKTVPVTVGSTALSPS